MEIDADRYILYEVTGYQVGNASEDFWTQYIDFFELGDDANLFRADMMMKNSKKEEYIRKKIVLTGTKRSVVLNRQ